MNTITPTNRVSFDGRQADRLDNFQTIYRYPVFNRDAFQTDMVRSLYDWWLSFDPAKPSWENFDILDHADIAPYLYLIKVLEDDWYEYRLNGEMVTRLVGNSMQGEKFTLDDANLSRRTLAAYCHELCESQMPRRCDGSLRDENGREVPFESLDCPLVDGNGKVTHTIGAIARTPH